MDGGAWRGRSWVDAEKEFASWSRGIGWVVGGGPITSRERTIGTRISEIAGGGGDHGKTSRALGIDLREHGYVDLADEAPAGPGQRSGVDAGGTGRGPRADQHHAVRGPVDRADLDP